MRSQPFALLGTLRVNETDASVFFAVHAAVGRLLLLLEQILEDEPTPSAFASV